MNAYAVANYRVCGRSAADWLAGFSGESEKSQSVYAPAKFSSQSMIALAHESPTPNAQTATFIDGLRRPEAAASASAIGMLAPPQLPMSCILK